MGEAWCFANFSKKGESQSAVGTLTNEIERRQQMSGHCLANASHDDQLPGAKASATSKNKRGSALLS